MTAEALYGSSGQILLLWEVVASDPVSIRVDATPQERRFWARVNRDGPVNPRRPALGPCWIWTGTRGKHNGELTYGHTSFGGRRMGAHRASFLMHGGTVPDGYDVMHLCDVKHCVRPSHLRAGTRTENLLDGFAAPVNYGVCAGENNGRARLTWDQVHAIREAASKGARTVDLAAQYGVGAMQITCIKAERRWPESKCPVHGSVRTVAA